MNYLYVCNFYVEHRFLYDLSFFLVLYLILIADMHSMGRNELDELHFTIFSPLENIPKKGELTKISFSHLINEMIFF